MSSGVADDLATIYQRPAELLQRLIRFDTTNPPGNEAACIAYIAALLSSAGITTTLLARDPARPNLIARLPGQGRAAPLLLYGHVDVVTTQQQTWTHPPFAGLEAEGCIWGRGALDMKGGLAMMLCALLRARAEGIAPPGDVLLAVVSDEEVGGEYGARYLIDEHAALFKGVRYAIGEFGAFTLYLGGRTFYPIMVAEKKSCGITAVLRGPGGHGSLPLRGGAMARLARFLRHLDEGRLPVHVTPITRQMLEMMSVALPDPESAVIGRLLDPTQTDATLDAMGPRGQLFDALLHNTVNATIVRGGHKENVIPSAIEVVLDGRLLPGYTPSDMETELRALVGAEVELLHTYYDPGPSDADMGLFETLASILREADPSGIPVPLLLSAVTDGRFFSRLGIQTYGFLPMTLTPDLDFSRTIHAADERIPVAALTFGAHAIYQALLRFGNGVHLLASSSTTAPIDKYDK